MRARNVSIKHSNLPVDKQAFYLLGLTLVVLPPEIIELKITLLSQPYVREDIFNIITQTGFKEGEDYEN